MGNQLNFLKKCASKSSPSPLLQPPPTRTWPLLPLAEHGSILPMPPKPCPTGGLSRPMPKTSRPTKTAAAPLSPTGHLTLVMIPANALKSTAPLTSLLAPLLQPLPPLLPSEDQDSKQVLTLRLELAEES